MCDMGYSKINYLLKNMSLAIIVITLMNSFLDLKKSTVKNYKIRKYLFIFTIS